MKGSQAMGRREGMATAEALKVLLATGPRALLRSTLTAPASAKGAPLRIACGELLSTKWLSEGKNQQMREQ